MKTKYLFHIGDYYLYAVAAWYDLWAGAFYDNVHGRLYLMIPMVGIMIQYIPKPGSLAGKV